MPYKMYQIFRYIEWSGIKPDYERPTPNVQLSTSNEKQKAKKRQCVPPFIERWMLNVERWKFIFKSLLEARSLPLVEMTNLKRDT